MSAPPMGMIRVIPRISARMKMPQKAHFASPPVITSTTTSATEATAIPMLSRWRAGRMIGAPLMFPFSLANAITEPVNVTAPISTPRLSSIRLVRCRLPSASAMPYASGL
jgi:hypothetical protein